MKIKIEKVISCCNVRFYLEISVLNPEPGDFRPKIRDFGSNPESWQPYLKSGVCSITQKTAKDGQKTQKTDRRREKRAKDVAKEGRNMGRKTRKTAKDVNGTS